MNSPQVVYQAFVGFDVSKDTVTVYNSQTDITQDVLNYPKELRKYIKTLPPKSLAICEPTGGYEATLLDALSHANVSAHRADARRVKAFIRSLGIHGKTDSIDAKALAEFGRERHPRLSLWAAPDQNRQELQALVARRSDLVAMRTAEKNRAQAPMACRKTGRLIKASCQKILKLITAEIKRADLAIQDIIQHDEHLQEMQDVLVSLKGVGLTIASGLLANMPELGTLSRRQVASLAGVAPHPRKSGKMQAYQKVSGGRAEVKRLLFMAAMVAARQNPELKVVYQRLIENGKKPIVALTALMRKIITILNAKIRDQIAQKQLS